MAVVPGNTWIVVLTLGPFGIHRVHKKCPVSASWMCAYIGVSGFWGFRAV